MHLSAIDRISPAAPIEQLPIRLNLEGSRGSFAISLLLTIPVVVFLVTPFALIGWLAAVEPDAFLRTQLSWLSTVQLGVGLLAVLAVAVAAVTRIKTVWVRSATVEVGHGVVAVVERGYGFTRRWTAPIQEFLGVAHNVRSSLSGSRHELVLVHPDTTRNVLLRVDSAIAQPHIDRLAILLGLSQIPARSIAGKSAARVVVSSGATSAAAPTPVPPLVGVPAEAKLRLAA
jgi:hypothetical protein